MIKKSDLINAPTKKRVRIRRVSNAVNSNLSKILRIFWIRCFFLNNIYDTLSLNWNKENKWIKIFYSMVHRLFVLKHRPNLKFPWFYLCLWWGLLSFYFCMCQSYFQSSSPISTRLCPLPGRTGCALDFDSYTKNSTTKSTLSQNRIFDQTLFYFSNFNQKRKIIIFNKF